LIICTNDDGLGTIGLESLAEVCREFGEVKVMAPDRERSLCSHSLDPTGELKLKEVRPEVFSLSGTPADCTRIALRHFDEKPALLCSGINHGGNLGVDALYSGTMAAAREAYLRGISAISFSMVLESGVEPDWSCVEMKARDVLELWRAEASNEPILWNVNFPSRVSEASLIVRCQFDSTPMTLNYERTQAGYRYVGNYHNRPRKEKGDVARCFGGEITLVDLSGGSQSFL
jgi:5'-nucleotidase